MDMERLQTQLSIIQIWDIGVPDCQALLDLKGCFSIVTIEVSIRVPSSRDYWSIKEELHTCAEECTRRLIGPESATTRIERTWRIKVFYKCKGKHRIQ